MDTPITRAEHEEFRRWIEAEDKRQNRRLDLLEENINQIQKESLRQIGELTAALRELAMNMSSMVQEQEQQGERIEKQGERLEKIESVPAKNWDTLKAGIIGAIATAAGGGIVAAIINYL